MQIVVRMWASDTFRIGSFEPEEIDLTPEEWRALSPEEQQKHVEEYCDTLEQPVWTPTSFEEL